VLRTVFEVGRQLASVSEGMGNRARNSSRGS
jgi:hypothetical protein